MIEGNKRAGNGFIHDKNTSVRPSKPPPAPTITKDKKEEKEND